MQVEFTLDAPEACVRARIRGKITAQGFSKFLQDLLALPSWRQGMPILSDYREADAGGLSTEDIRSMAAEYARLSDRIGPGRSALVVAESLEYGIARMWISWTEMKTTREIRVFQSLAEASAWLASESEDARGDS